MSDFILAVDLDGVVTQYVEALAEVIEEDRGLEPGSLPDPTTWSFDGWDLKEGDFERYHTELVVNRNGFRTMESVEGASEVLWRLSDAGVWIRIVTHRLIFNGHHAVVVADTVSSLEEHGIPFRDLCFLGAKPDVKADLYIDDGPHNIEALQAIGANTLVFDRSYNRDCTGPRAADWLEVEEYVLKAMEAK